jgi:N-acetylmuramoyl-L-alanine amidase
MGAVLLMGAPWAQAASSSNDFEAAKSADAALRSHKRNLRYRHRYGPVIELWQQAVRLETGPRCMDALRGWADLVALRAHWSGTPEDASSAKAAAVDLRKGKGCRAATSAESRARATPTRSESAWLTRVEAASEAEGWALDLHADGAYAVTRNMLPVGPTLSRVYFDISPMVASREALGTVRVPELSGLKRVRVGQFDAQTVRIVFDVEPGIESRVLSGKSENQGSVKRLRFLGATADHTEAMAVAPAMEQPDADTEHLQAIVEELKRAYPRAEVHAARHDPRVATKPYGRTSSSLQTPKATAKNGSVSSTNDVLRISKVVIDPGHGGRDHGAQGWGGLREKDVNLAIAQQLGRELAQRLGVKVVYTRSRDQYVSLAQRTQFANRAQADLFISVHANAHHNRKVKGVETYYLNTTSDRYARRLARRENTLDPAPMGDIDEGSIDEGESSLPAGALGQDVRLVLADLAMRSATRESKRLAGYVQSSIVGRLRNNFDDIQDLGVKHALFYVLLGARMPSVLVEAGFLTHPEEGRRLGLPRYQSRIAHAVADGVVRFSRERAEIAENLDNATRPAEYAALNGAGD